MKIYTLSEKKKNILFLLESIIFSVFSFFMLRGRFYYLTPHLVVINTAAYFSYGKSIKDKKFITVALFLPLIILFLIMFYLDYSRNNF